jgi:hypothetical protein
MLVSQSDTWVIKAYELVNYIGWDKCGHNIVNLWVTSFIAIVIVEDLEQRPG